MPLQFASRRARRALALGLLMTGLSAAPHAQTVSPPAKQTPAPPAVPALSAQERLQLQQLFGKVRPATLRIEDCPPNDCREPDGVGSAFLISADGLALTAYHVVFDARNLSAVTVNKQRYPLDIVGFDDQRDLALLRVRGLPKDTPFLPLAAAAPKVGDVALSVGNGDGSFLQPKTGRLSALDADAGRADYPPGTLELSSPLRPGDSGGPVINARGEAMGVASYITVKGREEQITGYAVPVTAGSALLAELKTGVKREAPVIGIGLDGEFSLLSALSAEEFEVLNRELELELGNTPGAFFTSVTPGGPAARAGLQPLAYNARGHRTSGDIVTAVNGKRIVNFSEFQYAVRALQPGSAVSLTVRRGEETLTVKMTLISRSQLQALRSGN